MDGALLFVLFAVAAIGIGVASWYFAEKRRQAFQAFAAQHGLEYSRTDPFDLLRLPFQLFRRGDGRRVENVLAGEWRGQPMRAFDYWYYTESTDSDGHRSKTYHRFTCVLIDVDARFPHLAIARENLFTRLADGLGFRDIGFESEEFNRRFQVSASERKFAYELVDARLMQWLLGLELPVAFEVVGGSVLASVKRRLPPEGFAPVIEVARTFRERIPRVAWSLYGQTTETAERGKEEG
jgi:hypothetical protein